MWAIPGRNLVVHSSRSRRRSDRSMKQRNLTRITDRSSPPREDCGGDDDTSGSGFGQIRVRHPGERGDRPLERPSDQARPSTSTSRCSPWSWPRSRTSRRSTSGRSPRTVHRPIGSIGKKLSNTSGVLYEINAWIPGYNPLSNLQGRLREVVADRFTGDAELRTFMLRSVEDPNIEPIPLGLDWIRRPWAGRSAPGIGPAWLASTSRRSSR